MSRLMGDLGTQTKPKYAASKHLVACEESMTLVDDTSLSHMETRSTSHQRRWVSMAQVCAGCIGLPSSLGSFLLRTGLFLLPSFVQPGKARDPRLWGGGGERGELPGPTSYLDGMRGLAALFVFFCHYSYTFFVIHLSWGYGDDNYHLLKLPIIRLFYQGPPMVCAFFVISGYALSLRPLKLMRARKLDDFATTMASFVFRRGFRLFLPTAVSTFMVLCFIRVGLYEWTRAFADDATYLHNQHEVHYGRHDTLSEQLIDWCRAMFGFVHVWGWEKFGGSTSYDPHLWTIPVEYRCSLMLFLALVGTARLRTAFRLMALAVVLCFTLRSKRWEMCLFYSGMVLAELDLARQAHSDPTTTAAVAAPHDNDMPGGLSALGGPGNWQDLLDRTGRFPTRRYVWGTLSVLALYLMSQPDQHGEETPGWMWLTSLIPSWWDYEDNYRFWQSVGSVLFVAAVARLPGWQRVFNRASVQYLTGVETDGAYLAGFVLAACINVPLVLWASDVFWRAIDAPVVRFAKWLEGVCSVQD